MANTPKILIGEKELDIIINEKGAEEFVLNTIPDTSTAANIFIRRKVSDTMVDIVNNISQGSEFQVVMGDSHLPLLTGVMVQSISSKTAYNVDFATMIEEITIIYSEVPVAE